MGVTVGMGVHCARGTLDRVRRALRTQVGTGGGRLPQLSWLSDEVGKANTVD